MISCDVIQDLLPLYADGQASEDTIKLIQAHLRDCECCASIANAMSMPLEPDEQREEVSYLDGLRKQKRKNRNRILWACLLTILVCTAAWWLYMESHFVIETPTVVSNSQEEILAEIPMLELSKAEMDFASQIPSIPIFQEQLQPLEIKIHPLDSVVPVVSAVLPDHTEVTEVSTIGSTIYITYQHNESHVILEYLDPNRDGVIDSVGKTIGLNSTSGDVDTVYSVQYACILDWTKYEKYVSKHNWFGFLNKEVFG